MSIEDHQTSRLISTQFRLLDCWRESDGAGAIVVTSVERARDLRKPPVLIAGVGEGHGQPPTSVIHKPDMTFIEGLHDAGRRALAMAEMEPDDIDCAEIHDGFSYFILASLEALGFCKPGESGPFVEEGGIALGGSLPVNTHGGALSEGHVSGVNHVIEGVRQLRDEVEPARQVAGCETVLVANEGDFHDASVLVLTR
jgi:acetyl-CoA acetyltransferase